ncbi:unnamed protein product [Angiostrongylus costaricensis]|uniref:Protein Skeletor n=1 Tax=Angiostrongylus costaricensis TaxID=334426 RepID=A0A0R3PZB7_ANGCS|nr:unnamed protein product [Angiostrongylus costaricensis]
MDCRQGGSIFYSEYDARWKRLGIDLRKVRYPIWKGTQEKPFSADKLPLALNEKSSSPSNGTGPIAEIEKLIGDVSIKKDEIRTAETPNTRKSMPLITEDKDVQTPKRPRIHGPILAVVPIPSDADAQKSGYGYGTGRQRSLAVDSVASSILPRFISPFAKPPSVNDYHSRTKPAFKSYKFMKKLSQRPRLRIRRPGAGFGAGPSELPPELANVGFEVSGNGINLNVIGPVSSTPSISKLHSERERPKQRKQPNPKIFKESEGLVIPQNSGRTDASASGFGGSSDITLSNSGQGPNPEDTHSDFFTGDSALTPSRGPTGDGYGPPIFPGGAIPPPVPAVGLGGAAAGKSPYVAVLEATENPPTTVKPSALLNVLNKADRGFNQAITHFEQESPLETAAIDILEGAGFFIYLFYLEELLNH